MMDSNTPVNYNFMHKEYPINVGVEKRKESQ